MLAVAVLAAVAPTVAQQRPAVDNRNAPILQFESVPEPLKLPPRMNFGEVLSVAVNSKGTVVVLNHPGTATSGPLYGNATTNLLEFDASGKYIGEIGQGVYGLGYAHSVRFDKYDNLWVVDKGTNSAMKFTPDRDGASPSTWGGGRKGTTAGATSGRRRLKRAPAKGRSTVRPTLHGIRRTTSTSATAT
jgi:hypothetical protein